MRSRDRDTRVGSVARLSRRNWRADRRSRAREAFDAARAAFKRVEVGLEYCAPFTARAMNGPALPAVEETEGPEAVYDPTGFQVIEEGMFGDAPRQEQSALLQEVRTLQQLVAFLQALTDTTGTIRE